MWPLRGDSLNLGPSRAGCEDDGMSVNFAENAGEDRSLLHDSREHTPEDHLTGSPRRQDQGETWAQGAWESPSQPRNLRSQGRTGVLLPSLGGSPSPGSTCPGSLAEQLAEQPAGH